MVDTDYSKRVNTFLIFRICPIFQISNVTGENLDLLKSFLNLLSIRGNYEVAKPPIFQIDDTYSVPVSNNAHDIHIMFHTSAIKKTNFIYMLGRRNSRLWCDHARCGECQ